jgi:two-component system, chemotaxis family, chemotaxis protein CheY
MAHTKRILIVDDFAIMRKVLANMLGTIGYQVVDGVADGAQALEILRRNKYDLVICDLLMEPLRGSQLARMMRQDRLLVAIPFIMISADASEEAQAEVDALGIDAFLLKPFTAIQLQTCLTGIFDRRELARRA